MKRVLLAGSIGVIWLGVLGAEAGALGQVAESELDASQSPESDQARQDAERDARWERLQAEIAAGEAARRAEQERYEQGIRDAEAARIQYEAAMARHREEVESAGEAQADYQRRIADYESTYSGRRSRSASDPTVSAGASGVPDGSKNCERQREQERRRGRALGGLIGGIAAGLATGLNDRPVEEVVGAVALSVPIGALLGDAIASRLDCDEQVLAASATERAVEGGVGTSVDWSSETRPGVTGSSTVLAVERGSDGAECVNVTDIVIIDGEETRAPKRMCRQPPSNRFVRV